MTDFDFEQEVKQLNATPDPKTLLRTLQSYEGGFPNSDIAVGFSGLTADEFEIIRPAWESISPEGRVRIIRDLADMSEADYSRHYETLGYQALDDKVSEVRKEAVDLLWIVESPALMEKLASMVNHDTSEAVRVRSLSELGRFLLLGEYEEIPEETVLPVQEQLLSLFNSTTESIEIRRRALEAFSNSSHAQVKSSIETAYADKHHLMKVSAVFAMGRSCDARWETHILNELDNDYEDIRYEAARSAGQIELESAVPRLIELAEEDDREIQEVVVWSLGEIANSDAIQALYNLQESLDDNDSLNDAIDDAIMNANMMQGASSMLSLDD